MAREALHRATRPADPGATSIAHRALGLADREQHDLAGALRELTLAVEVAAAHGLPELEGVARGSLASVLAAEGRVGPALAELDRAAALVEGAEAAQVLMQRATVLQR